MKKIIGITVLVLLSITAAVVMPRFRSVASEPLLNVIKINNAYAAVHSTLNLGDNITPPVLVMRNTTRQMGTALDVYEIVQTVYENAPIVSLALVNPPDYFTPGVQTVAVRAEDIFGNYTEDTAMVMFMPNNVPPVINGAADIFVSRGEPIRYRAGVYAVDAFGRDAAFYVDNTQVNNHERGIYPAIYTAVDAWGLVTTSIINVHILSVDPEDVYAQAAQLLERILRDDMTQVQQARTMFNWLQANVSFAAGPVAYYSAYEAAYQGFIQRRGNCFVFASMMQVLLTQAEIPNLPMIRTRYHTGTSRHRWNLFNPDGLGWFHLDATPNQHLWPNRRFMFTQEEAYANTAFIFAQNNRTRGFYNFDDDLHPHITIE